MDPSLVWIKVRGHSFPKPFLVRDGPWVGMHLEQGVHSRKHSTVLQWLINMIGHTTFQLKWVWHEWASALHKCFLIPLRTQKFVDLVYKTIDFGPMTDNVTIQKIPPRAVASRYGFEEVEPM